MENKKPIKKVTKKVVTTKKKTNKKKTKGFTLIELLAVIIILGVLMIIAIPSVTTYISNSRKSAYIDTAKNVIGAARNLVNSGKFETYNRDVTYYLPVSCLPSENGAKTPYGEFSVAYVILTYDGSGYSYYFTGNDSSKTGIKKIITYDKLDEEDIESDVEDTDITSNVGIGGRSKVMILNSSCNDWENPIEAGSSLNDDGTFTPGYTGYAYLYHESGYADLGARLGTLKKQMWIGISVYDDVDGYYQTSNYYDTVEECNFHESFYGEESCISREVFYDDDLGEYEIEPLNYKKAIYVKMYITNNVLKDAWVCVNADREVCLKANDSSEYQNSIEKIRSLGPDFIECEDYGNGYDCEGKINLGIESNGTIFAKHGLYLQCIFVHNEGAYIGCPL